MLLDTSPGKSLLVYDGDCGFCRRWVTRWQALTGDRVDFAPFQGVAGRFPKVALKSFGRAVGLIEPDGGVCGGAEAVFRTLHDAPGRRWMLWGYKHVPGAGSVARWVYGFVARHRQGFSPLADVAWGRDLNPSSYLLSRWLFLRLLGVVFFIAMVFLWTQIDGLVGRHGVLPAAQLLEVAQSHWAASCYWRLPTLCWVNSSDAFLHGLCAAGVILSLLLVVGIAPIPVLAMLWLVYLSLSVVGQMFLGFQWDVLLLETGFLAIFFAPGRWVPGLTRENAPPVLGRWLLWLLVFKLMFLSGVTKLLSGDATWRQWTAMAYHYETQPIPTWTSWYAHHLPLWIHKTSVVGMFMIELVVVFFIFAPWRMRHVGCAALILLQAMTAATGNYGFFNLLAIVLCLLLLDDHLLRRFLPFSRMTAWVGDVPRPRLGCRWLHRVVVRLVLYRYQLTDPQTKREHGAWWSRYRKGLLTRPVSRVGGDPWRRGGALRFAHVPPSSATRKLRVRHLSKIGYHTEGVVEIGMLTPTAPFMHASVEPSLPVGITSSSPIRPAGIGTLISRRAGTSLFRFRPQKSGGEPVALVKTSPSTLHMQIGL